MSNLSGSSLPNIHVVACANYCYDATTDGSGSFSFLVVPGLYELSMEDYSGAYATGFYSSSGFTYDQGAATLLDATTLDVTVNPALPPAIQAYVTVKNDAGQAVAGAGCNFMLNSAQTTVLTDAGGRCQFAVRPGSWWIWFGGTQDYAQCAYVIGDPKCEDVWPGSVMTVTATSPDFHVAVALISNLQIQGKVTGPGGTPLGYVFVAGFTLDGRHVASATTNSDGTYSLGLPPGTYYLSFTDSGSTYQTGYYSSSGFTTNAGAATPITLSAGNVGGIDLEMPLA